MINPQLILSDIDGTLLNDAHQLLPSVIQAVQHYVQNGGKFCLASARPAKAMTFLAAQMGLTMPLATLNGAYIIKSDLPSTILFQQPISASTIIQIIQIIKQNHLAISLNLYAGTKWLIEQPNYWSSQEAQITLTQPTVTLINSRVLHQPIHKVLCMGQPASIQQLANLLIQKPQLKINAARSKPTYLEITDQKVSKEAALKHLAVFFHVPLAQTMAIGDGDNDLGMVQTAGIGIALANATPSLIAAANFVGPSNNQAGVATVLKKYTTSN